MGSICNGGYLLNLSMKKFIKINLCGIGVVRLNIQEDITAYESAKMMEFMFMINLGASFMENQHFIDTFSIIKRHFKIE